MSHALALAALLLAAAATAAPAPAAPAAARPAAPEAPQAPVESPVATFALILGVNRSANPELPALRFADDDAARYLDLFRRLGARTYLLARLDDNTRRLHPQAAAEALEPRMDMLRAQVRHLHEDILQARRRGVRAELYVVYAGHGELREGTGTISLEDGALSGAQLSRDVLAPAGADRVHLIVDACHSYYLAYGRGPGGERRPLSGFISAPELSAAGNVGLLLSTSSARESHEWEGVQAGIFHHEVRSGLMGAADADRDGRVSYREIAAFVAQANAAIPNERFRPQVHARAPRDSERLMDLRPGLARRLEVNEALGGHYLLEDGNGVRVAEFHSAPGEAVHLLRPPPGSVHYLRRLGDGAGREEAEYALPAAPEVLALESLDAQPVQVAYRGAAHEAFSRLFSLPFGAGVVSRYTFPPLTPPPVPDGAPWRTRLGWGGVGLGAASAGAALLFARHASALQGDISSSTSQADVMRQNARIRSANGKAALFAGAGLAAAAAGGLLLWWPWERMARPGLALSPDGAALSLASEW